MSQYKKVTQGEMGDFRKEIPFSCPQVTSILKATFNWTTFIKKESAEVRVCCTSWAVVMVMRHKLENVTQIWRHCKFLWHIERNSSDFRVSWYLSINKYNTVKISEKIWSVRCWSDTFLNQVGIFLHYSFFQSSSLFCCCYFLSRVIFPNSGTPLFHSKYPTGRVFK